MPFHTDPMNAARTAMREWFPIARELSLNTDAPATKQTPIDAGPTDDGLLRQLANDYSTVINSLTGLAYCPIEPSQVFYFEPFGAVADNVTATYDFWGASIRRGIETRRAEWHFTYLGQIGVTFGANAGESGSVIADNTIRYADTIAANTDLTLSPGIRVIGANSSGVANARGHVVFDHNGFNYIAVGPRRTSGETGGLGGFFRVG